MVFGIGCLMFLFLRFHFAFHHPLDCSAEKITQSVLDVLRGLYVVFLDQSRDDLSCRLSSTAIFLVFPFWFSCVFYSIIPQIQGDLQKKVNRLIIAAHDNRISDAADELLYMKDGRIEKI